jgi:hypothetical protein
MRHRSAERISPVTLADPVWRYLVLFQSWNQLISWGALMGATMSVVALLIWLVGDVRLIPTTLMWGLFGATWSLVLATKAQFSIRGAVISEKEEIEQMLNDCMYAEQKPMGQEKRFRQKLPTWLRWQDSDVTIVMRGGALVCTGPQLVIRRIRRALLSSC